MFLKTIAQMYPPSCGKLSLLSIIREIMLIPLFRSPDAPIQVKCPQQSCPVYLSQLPQLPPPCHPPPHHPLTYSSSPTHPRFSLIAHVSLRIVLRVTLSDKDTCKRCTWKKSFYFQRLIDFERPQNVITYCWLTFPPLTHLSHPPATLKI